MNQAIALLKGGKSDGESALTKVYHSVQKSPLLLGIRKTYEPRDEDGEKLPGESTKLQIRVPEVMSDAVAPLSRLLDLVATVDLGNQVATADVKVNGVTILQKVPVSTLLFLERKLVDIAALVDKLPVLDAAEEWLDNEDGSWKTVPSIKVRTKKVPRVLEKAPATDKHPAQVEVWHEDIVVGDWTTTTFSGAVTQKRQRELANNVKKLQIAVKIAREEANSTDVQDFKIGEDIFKFLGWSAE